MVLPRYFTYRRFTYRLVTVRRFIFRLPSRPLPA